MLLYSSGGGTGEPLVKANPVARSVRCSFRVAGFAVLPRQWDERIPPVRR